MKTYNKLVRDRIPKIIESDGRSCKTRKITGVDLHQALKSKLQEELNEYLKDENAEELSDIMEVLVTLARVHGIDLKRLEQIRLDKKESSGGFDDGVFLLSVGNSEDL